MKKKVLTFGFILISFFVFGCAEEVMPTEPIIEEETNSIVVDEQKSETDDEEEDDGMKPPVG